MKSYLFLFFFIVTFIQVLSQNAKIELNKGIQFSEHKFLPFYNLKKSKNTAIFQGNKKKKNYFEGWYFKMVAEDGESVISVIPGISLPEKGKEQHAFIQIINGKNATTSYHSFPIESFSFSKKEFAVKIGQNYFSKEKIILNLKDDSTNIVGEVKMSNTTNYSDRKIGKRKIMGWYRRVPFMECYHGVVSLTHDLKGQLTIGNEVHNFNKGKGYIEKDWGSSMPKHWIWIQSNHFENTKTSFMLSIANVPFMGNAFDGFLGFLYYKEKVYRFATYKNSKLNVSILDSNTIAVEIKNKKETIKIEAKRNSIGILKAPVAGQMDRRIPESIDAEIKITLIDKKGDVIYEDNSNITGLELVGAFRKLAGEIKKR